VCAPAAPAAPQLCAARAPPHAQPPCTPALLLHCRTLPRFAPQTGGVVRTDTGATTTFSTTLPHNTFSNNTATTGDANCYGPHVGNCPH
jgi:hypothetical protein